MGKATFNKLNGYELNAIPDLPDIRDHYYEPALIPLQPTIGPANNLLILDQGQEGACVGFGLAATINLLLTGNDRKKSVSPRMLYEMARKFDEWEGVAYSGSSCRGGIRGWYHNGVCLDASWPYKTSSPEWLTRAKAAEAKETTIGAYYRLRPHIVDYHAALNEVGVLFASAQVHKGWQSPKGGVIKENSTNLGGHAFAVVGYNDIGFWVQNSWGPKWGDHGVALWTYEDWQKNVTDAWVGTIARPTPTIFPGVARMGMTPARQAQFGKKPTRAEIAGHFVHLDDGNFHDKGRYYSNLQDVQETGDVLKNSPKYDHILLYAHGGFNSPVDSARRIAAMKDTFKKNGIYPYHFIYDTGFKEELKDIIIGKKSKTVDRAEGLMDITDRLIEVSIRWAAKAFWSEMKKGARSAFESGGDGRVVLDIIGDVLKNSSHTRKLHIAGHSTGAVLFAWLLKELDRRKFGYPISSCSLMAPAATEDLFNTNYAPYLAGNGLRINDFGVYNLSEKLELDDKVVKIYRKSMLYMVSRAAEEKIPAALLGMMKYAKNFEALPSGSLYISTGKNSGSAVRPTSAEGHLEFDNDPDTMNHILKRILGKKPKVPFTKESLKY